MCNEQQKDISAIDKNFAVEIVREGDTEFYDVRKEPFDLYGFYEARTEFPFKRLPDEVATKVNDGVKSLYFDTAGGRVRFMTDSPHIILRARMKRVTRLEHMPLLGTAGFDLYVDTEDGAYSRYVRPFIPPRDVSDEYTAKVPLGAKKKRFITINFPSYSKVNEVYIGVESGSCVGHGVKYKDMPPIVYYGSSITQGACSSRPGNIYQNVIARRTNIDYINLGFSGNGKAEDTIVEYMATLKMSAFVCDYDHNAPAPEYLRATHQKMYDKIRAAKPDVPYIMISRPDFDCSYDENILRRDVIIDTYRHARANGDKNVYYIDGASVFRGRYSEMCTADHVHPNDLGFALMADAVEAELARAFTQNLL